jgi:hypothetical protein
MVLVGDCNGRVHERLCQLKVVLEDLVVGGIHWSWVGVDP